MKWTSHLAQRWTKIPGAQHAAQINYKWHGDKFSSIEDMLSPEVNIQYAAKLLAKLKQQHGNWHKAIRIYHSSNLKYHRQYSRRVVLCWLGV